MEELITKYLYDPIIAKIVIVCIGLVILWSLLKFLKGRLRIKITNKFTRYKTGKLINFSGFIISLILITIVYSEKLGGLTVAFGVAGAGIAFALQEIIVSIAGWIAIVFAGFYKTGDRVQLGGIKGDVIDIGVLRTRIMEIGNWVDGDLYNGRIVLVANSFIFKEPVFNYSGDFPFLWDEIKIPIQYGSDYEETEKILLSVINEVVGDYSKSAEKYWEHISKQNLVENASVEPMISITLNDNWVEFTVRYTVKFDKRRSTKNLIFKNILKEIENSKKDIKFASATFHLVEAPKLDVNVHSI